MSAKRINRIRDHTFKKSKNSHLGIALFQLGRILPTDPFLN